MKDIIGIHPRNYFYTIYEIIPMERSVYPFFNLHNDINHYSIDNILY